ncbi:MAG: hypothetical protein GIW99_11040 [Candidatus Eremiobacteraeota bacterium]|nr:hypothetical protein [Candidatus Eremiobacteraeota bacterium]MBC5828195.1 hypothetical protein [Candidatus Eremiobacteraeota bacterium]
MRRAYPYIWTATFIAAGLGSYLLVRLLVEPEPDDPTRGRIRALIDEADQLLRTLDEQRRD